MALALLAARPAQAQTAYTSTREVLTNFFRSSQSVTYRKVELGSSERARVKAKLGYEVPRSTYTFYVAQTSGKIDGYAIIDEENGEHLPITFAVKIATNGTVERQEVVAYREARGDEVRDLSFRKQFVGKGVDDPIAVERDIAVVSGATISSRAMAVGVRRAVVLFDLFVRPSATTAQLGPAQANTSSPGKL